MSISITAGTGRKTARVLSQYRVVQEAPDRLVMQTKRIAALLAAAFVGTFGGVVTAAAARFYPPVHEEDVGTLALGGGLGVVLLVLAVMFLYFSLRKPDRILVDAERREVRFERRRDPMTLPFDLLAEVALRTEDRSRPRERCVVHPVVLVTRDGRELQVDAASDIEQMIALAAKLRNVTGLGLRKDRVA